MLSLRLVFIVRGLIGEWLASNFPQCQFRLHDSEDWFVFGSMHGESHGYGFGVVYFMFHLIQFILCSLFNLFHSINLLNPHLLCIYVYIHSLYLLIIILVTFFVRYTLWSPLWTIPTYSILPIGFFKLMLPFGHINFWRRRRGLKIVPN